MEAKIRQKLEELRAMLQSDNGDLELVAIDGNTVKLRLKGACRGCPHATQTIKQGIEAMLRRDISEAITVEQVQ
ncbi:MAG: NifU family protein [Lentisphaerae bacterium]|nr:NifU family protein [Lentisphaerota bacterium]